MNKKLAMLVAVPALSLSTATFAADGAPKVFGNLNVGVTKVDSTTDIDGQAFEAALGVKGAFNLDEYKLIYKLEAEFTDAVNNANGESELEIKNAKVIMPSKYGTFVVAARGESVQQLDMYKVIDIFEVNEANTSTLWGQPDEASSVFAYKSPTFGNTYVSTAVLTLNSSGTPDINNNDNDVDAFVMRAIYSDKQLYLGVGNVAISSDQTGASETYHRSTFTAGYKFAKADIGLTWEHQGDHPSGSDSDVIGIATDIQLANDWSLGLGYTDRDSENDAKDDSATMVIVRKHLHKNLYAWAEAANYENSDNNYSVGINVRF